MSTQRKKDLSMLLSALVTVRDVPKYRDVGGICLAVRRVATDNEVSYPFSERAEMFDLLADAFMAWPKYSGNIKYPVPDPCYMSGIGVKSMAADAYRLSLRYDDDFWEGRYGELRWELLHFLISYITELYESEQEDTTS